MTPIIVELNDLCSVCGFFNKNTEINNGYGCNHPDQQETEYAILKDGHTFRPIGVVYPEKAVTQGKCYSFSCPLAEECDLQDLKENDIDRYNEWKDAEFDPSEAGAELMLIENENLIKKLTN